MTGPSFGRRAAAAPGARMRPDGFFRTDQEQRDLDHAFAATFSPENPASIRVLDYIEAITVRRVISPEASADALRHQEGMRGLYALIRGAIDRGRAG